MLFCLVLVMCGYGSFVFRQIPLLKTIRPLEAEYFFWTGQPDDGGAGLHVGLVISK
jgi:hypothetical protein